MLPNLPYHVHDPARPHPPVVTPAATAGGAPSDAVVLFDGKDLAKWQQRGKGPNAGKLLDAQWKVEDGYFDHRRRHRRSPDAARSSATASCTWNGRRPPKSAAPARAAATAASF